tara:strand:- start:1359 stop:1511 length:153 start_codon:yes stop_codon:yes gene_type:complete
MKEFKIIVNGRTPRWHWQRKWCFDRNRSPAQQPWYIKAYHAYSKEHNHGT